MYQPIRAWSWRYQRYSTLGKLIDIFVIIVVDSGQFFLEGFFIQGQAFAQFRQGGIGIPQLRIDIAD